MTLLRLQHFVIDIDPAQITTHFGWLTPFVALARPAWSYCARRPAKRLGKRTSSADPHENRGNPAQNQFLSIEDVRSKIKGWRDGNNDCGRHDDQVS